MALTWGTGQEGGTNIPIGPAAPEPNWYDKYGLANMLNSALTISQEKFKQQQALEQQAAKYAADMAGIQTHDEALKVVYASKEDKLMDDWLTTRQGKTGKELDFIDNLYKNALEKFGHIFSEDATGGGGDAAAAAAAAELERKKKLRGRVGGAMKSVADSPWPWLTGAGMLGKTAMGAFAPSAIEGAAPGLSAALGGVTGGALASSPWLAPATASLPAAAAIGGAGLAGYGAGRAIGGSPARTTLGGAASSLIPPGLSQNIVNQISQGKTVDQMIQEAFLSIMRNQQQK